MDPISDGPASKRRKLGPGDDVHGQERGRGWDSDNDSGDNLNEADFASATIPTQPVTGQKLPNNTNQTYITQPTQPIYPPTQATQPVPRPSQILVDRSSPPPRTDESTSSPGGKARPAPPPARGMFSRPGGVLANAMAPVGTAFRRPAGTVPRRRTPDLDSDEDPPVHHSSDDEGATQALRSNIKPTSFTKNGRGLDSSPNRIQESPRAAPPPRPAGNAPTTAFMSLLAGLEHKPQQGGRPPADDMASAYGGTSRPPRPVPAAQRPRAAVTEVKYKTTDDVQDPSLRKKVHQVLGIFPHVSVQVVVDTLLRKRGSVSDAMTQISEMEEAAREQADSAAEKDELSLSPVRRKGVATSVNSTQAHGAAAPAGSQPVRNAAKAHVKVPAKSIAERYGARKEALQQQQQQNHVVELSDDEDDVKPKRRLVQGRKPSSRPSSPLPSSPPVEIIPAPKQVKPKAPITIESDEEEEEAGPDTDEGGSDIEEVDSGSSDLDEQLLKFFNECSARALAELCAQAEDIITQVLAHRPFRDLEHVRSITITGTTKSGKASRARPVGDKLVDDCSEMLRGYTAVDSLVLQCEKLAAPVQAALKSWGVREAEGGELQLMNLDGANDSGIGTPSSVGAEDGVPRAVADGGVRKAKGEFIRQPPNMNPEYTLKDYQLVGINWLNLLFKQETSCILADDMGLGKTCQVIAFLAHLQTQQVDGVHLIIVPGSTLENWLREFERFAPDMNVRPYYGSQKEREEVRWSLEEDFDTLDVIVTTYDMAVGQEDNHFLRKLGPFSVCVYDEAHALRNPKSNRYQQLVRIGADFKVLLTGTPLQNNLQELIAILAFIMPAMFEAKRHDLEFIFKHKASTKDTDSAALFSSERISRARTMMTPFILRRKKHQVLDLPAKHCRVEYCDMTDSQADLYNTVLSEAQDLFTHKAAGVKMNAKVSAKASSNVIMSLRKAAIHPLLSRNIYSDKRIDRIVSVLAKSDEFGGNAPEKIRAYVVGDSTTGVQLKGGDYGIHRFCAERPLLLGKFALKHEEWMDAGKVRKFTELVTAYAANGDRALVFSQFTTAMDILEQVLETLGIKFVRLDGSTKMDLRQELIDTFYNDDEIKVFMLSTRAGGAGINLAAANKVIIFDSGFNPQDDVQAENRAHRVGQTREVEVVRLVTRGTIEEQIHALGESKLALDERVAGDAAAADSKALEKAGEQMVEKMFAEKLATAPAAAPKKEEKPKTEAAAEDSGATAAGIKEKKGKKEGGEAAPAPKIRLKKKADDGADLKEMFKKGLEQKGVKVKSKQATL